MEDNNEKMTEDYTQIVNTDEVAEALARAEAEKENGGALRQRRAAALDEQVEDESEVEQINEEEIEKPQEKVEVKKEEKTKEKKPKTGGKKINVRLICFIVILIAVVIITISLLVLKIKSINSKYVYEEPVQSVFEQEEKEVDTSALLVAKDGDLYDVNGITATEYIYQNGRNVDVPDYNQPYYNYIQIDGLKNKDVQNKINARIKEMAINNEYRQGLVSYDIGVANIFSVEYSFAKGDYINGNVESIAKGTSFDLNTGNELTVDDIFTKSTPIVSILTSAYSRGLAWTTSNANLDRGYGIDMSKADMSEYEDLMYKIKSLYTQNKDKLTFFIRQGRIVVYNLENELHNYYSSDDATKVTRKGSLRIEIPTEENLDYIICFNKFKNGDLFENPSVIRNIPLYCRPSLVSNKGDATKQLVFENSGNYICDLSVQVDTLPYYNQAVYDTVKKIATEELGKYKNQANADPSNRYFTYGTVTFSVEESRHTDYRTTGYIIPCVEVSAEYNAYKVDGSIPLYEIYSVTGTYNIGEYHFPTTVGCLLRSKDKYKNAIKDITTKNEGYVSEMKSYFFDLQGNYLGDSIECVKSHDEEIYMGS